MVGGMVNMKKYQKRKINDQDYYKFIVKMMIITYTKFFYINIMSTIPILNINYKNMIKIKY